MRNYIKAELYRNFNRVYFWNFVGITSIVTLLFNLLMKIFNPFPQIPSLSMLYQMGIGMLGLPIYLVGIIIDMVIGEESKNLTLKNVVSFGIPRGKIILSKIIVVVILSFIAAIIILTIFYGSGVILFGADDLSLDLSQELSLRLLAAIPLWIGAISVGTLMGYILNNNTLFAFVYTFTFALTGNLLKFLSALISDKIMYIYNILITTQIKNLTALPMLEDNSIQAIASDTLFSAISIGAIYTVVFAVLSILYFSKKEVK